MLESPDHPGSWYVDSFDTLGQYLKWDADTRALKLDVVYGRDLSADGTDPTRTERFTLSFPQIHNDGAGKLFAQVGGQAVYIGQLARDIFGLHVRLARGVTVEACRQNGSINASIVLPSPPLISDR